MSKKKDIAEESLKTKRAREKLVKKLATIDSHVTKENLDKTRIEIHRWISRHADKRIPVREKSISLFDENENAVEVSRKVMKLAEQIQTKSPEYTQNQ